MPAPSSFGRASASTPAVEHIAVVGILPPPPPPRPHAQTTPHNAPACSGESRPGKRGEAHNCAGETRPASPHQGQEQPKAAAARQPQNKRQPRKEGTAWAAPVPRRRRRVAAHARQGQGTSTADLPRPILPHRMKKHPRAMNIEWTSPPVGIWDLCVWKTQAEHSAA